MRAALLALLAVAVLIGLLWAAQRRLIYFPDTAAPPAAARTLPGARDVTLDTADGLRLTAWLVPPTGPDRRIGVLVTPGNGGNRTDRLPLARALADVGLTVLLLEYRGYGGNPGRPSESGLAQDARAARRYLGAAGGIAADRVIYFGESLGAAVATELASTEPPAGLLLRSPFTDLAAVGRHHYPALPVRALLRDRYPVAQLIAGIRVPTVVVYGTADTVVPPQQSRAVGQAAGQPARLVAVPDADHNDARLVHGAAVVAAVVALADGIDA